VDRVGGTAKSNGHKAIRNGTEEATAWESPYDRILGLVCFSMGRFHLTGPRTASSDAVFLLYELGVKSHDHAAGTQG
jgi:hypothetical protein